jgi:ribonuclease HI
MLNKIPTDDNLRERGCNLTSMCSLCNSNIETIFHLFFECRFAFGFWCWLATSLDMIIQFQSLEDIWSLCNRAISAQCRIVIKAAIINIMYAVWIARNNARFKNIKPNWNSSLAWIVANVMLSGNHTNSLASASIRDFTILKAFKVNLNPPKPSFLREVIWQPPPPQWIKCNIDGAFTSSAAACAGLFRNSSADFICGFASRLNTSSAFSAELYGFINAVDFAVSRGWNNLWIESDSELVVKAHKSATLVPWFLSNKWYNCMSRTRNMNIIVSHIYREGNHCADGLAKLGLNLNSVLIWNDVPVEIRDSFDSNKHGKPCFRVVHS